MTGTEMYLLVILLLSASLAVAAGVVAFRWHRRVSRQENEATQLLKIWQSGGWTEFHARQLKQIPVESVNAWPLDELIKALKTT